MIDRHAPYFILLLLSLFLTSCTPELSLVEHELKEVSTIPEDTKPVPIGFKRLKYTIPTGTTVASYGCNGYNRLLIENGGFAKQMDQKNAKRVFNDALEAQGYDVTGRAGFIFDEAEDDMRTILAVGAHITDIKMNICPGVTRFLKMAKEKGAVEITVEWTVFDYLKRKNIYKTITQGYSKSNAFNMEGIQLTLEESFAVAAHNLGADPIFKDMVVSGVLPEKLPYTVENPEELPPGKFDPNEKVVITNKQISNRSANSRFEELRKVAVRIEVERGHGSGYFVSDQGHIITNAHVVGYSSRARISTSEKRKKIIAEVLRVDRLRDVALLKLEEIPEGLDIKILPIRTDIPKIGDDLYAIGTPQYKKLQDTVTKGIMSAYRYDSRDRHHHIQGDVPIHGGNSGGPLLDGNGNIVGMSVAGYGMDEKLLNASLNLFIPIGEALDKLKIELE